ncbi:MAG: tRNA pseudouridine(38-40) synthase TruA [Firmicutes bacterium]|nr:tRNA pseudouridine(38-40) synthase TruA [Bacillota bacterium]
MDTYCLKVQYEGTAYSGFQIQPDQPTIQGKLEEALAKLATERIRVVGAGRTDAGVHSEGQIVSFRSSGLTVPTAKLPYALNRLLPGDIRVVGSERRAKNFHAQRSALEKTYRYQIYQGPFPNVFWRRYALWERNDLNWPEMERCSRLLVGTLDFAAFAASGSSVKTTVRSMHQIELDWEGPLKTIRFTADGFLYKMVRNLVGTLLDVGRCKVGAKDIEALLASGDRRLGSATVAPQGLFLESVRYA